MYLFVKFVHVIAAMVFFGLPFAFGRWFHVATLSKETAVWDYTMSRMRLFLKLHMNVCAAFLLVTGIWLTLESGGFALWTQAALVLLGLALLNLHLTLGRVLGSSSAQPDASRALSMRRRFALFMALHHTLVTAATALMIFRWT